MATASNPFIEGYETARDRKNALEDEQRKVTLKTLQEDAETPADKLAAIQAVYHQDPGVLKQHVENMTRKLIGRPTQPVVSQQQAEQARIAPIAARGKTPDQQALEFNQQNTQNQQNAQAEGKKKLFAWYQSLPPDQQKIAAPIIGVKEPAAPYRNYVSPDGKQRQAFQVGTQPADWQIAPTGSSVTTPAAKPLEAGGIPYGIQTPSGTFFANQMDDPSTPPEVKQTWQVIQSGLQAKQAEQEKKQREADDRQMRSLAAIAGRMGQSEQFQEQMAGYRADLNTYRALDKQARDDEALVNMYTLQLKQPGNKSAFDTALVTDYTGILAKGGRKTQAEIQFAQKIGGLGLRVDRMWQQAQSGELPPQMRQLYVDYMKARAASDRAEADSAKPVPPVVGGQKKGPAPKSHSSKSTVIVVSPEDMK